MFICRKRSKCLLFKKDEKTVRTALQEFTFFTDKADRSNVVCLTDMASIELSKQWYKNRKENFNDEKVRIITATANLTKNEIRCIGYETDAYPSKENIKLGAEFSPLTLKVLK